MLAYSHEVTGTQIKGIAIVGKLELRAFHHSVKFISSGKSAILREVYLCHSQPLMSVSPKRYLLICCHFELGKELVDDELAIRDSTLASIIYRVLKLINIYVIIGQHENNIIIIQNRTLIHSWSINSWESVHYR